MWTFFQLDRLIKNDLYFRQRKRQAQAGQRGECGAGRDDAPTAGSTPAVTASTQGPTPTTAATSDAAGGPGHRPDGIRRGTKRAAADTALRPERHAELFGRIDPRHIPESASWFHGQQKHRMASSADHELGLPTPMVTMTQHDNSPELLAHARRGPCAQPSAEDRF